MSSNNNKDISQKDADFVFAQRLDRMQNNKQGKTNGQLSVEKKDEQEPKSTGSPALSKSSFEHLANHGHIQQLKKQRSDFHAKKNKPAHPTHEADFAKRLAALKAPPPEKKPGFNYAKAAASFLLGKKTAKAIFADMDQPKKQYPQRQALETKNKMLSALGKTDQGKNENVFAKLAQQSQRGQDAGALNTFADVVEAAQEQKKDEDDEAKIHGMGDFTSSGKLMQKMQKIDKAAEEGEKKIMTKKQRRKFEKEQAEREAQKEITKKRLLLMSRKETKELESQDPCPKHLSDKYSSGHICRWVPSRFGDQHGPGFDFMYKLEKKSGLQRLWSVWFMRLKHDFLATKNTVMQPLHWIVGITSVAIAFGESYTRLDWVREIVERAAPALQWFITMFCGIVGFLIVFRVKFSYERYWITRMKIEKFSTQMYNSCQLLCVLDQITATTRQDHFMFRAKMCALYGALHAEVMKELSGMRRHLPTIATKYLNRQQLAHYMGSGYLHGGVDEESETRVRNNVNQCFIWCQMFSIARIQVSKAPKPIWSKSFDLFARAFISYGDALTVRTTPFPQQFRHLIRAGLLLMIFLLPVLITHHVKDTWIAGAITLIISLTYFSANSMGDELEDPFGEDYNDHPLEIWHLDFERELQNLIRRAGFDLPCVRDDVKDLFPKEVNDDTVRGVNLNAVRLIRKGEGAEGTDHDRFHNSTWGDHFERFNPAAQAAVEAESKEAEVMEMIDDNPWAQAMFEQTLAQEANKALTALEKQKLQEKAKATGNILKSAFGSLGASASSSTSSAPAPPKTFWDGKGPLPDLSEEEDPVGWMPDLSSEGEEAIFRLLSDATPRGITPRSKDTTPRKNVKPS